MITHDLRGPATSIQLGSDIALKGIKKLISKNRKVSFSCKPAMVRAEKKYPSSFLRASSASSLEDAKIGVSGSLSERGSQILHVNAQMSQNSSQSEKSN